MNLVLFILCCIIGCILLVGYIKWRLYASILSSHMIEKGYTCVTRDDVEKTFYNIGIYSKAAIELSKALTKGNVWISIREKMPEKWLHDDGTLIEFIIADSDYDCAKTAYFSGSGFYYEGFEYKPQYYENVTHWMPLPEMPKRGDVNE